MKNIFADKSEISAIEAKDIAQQWAFAPVFFQTIVCLRKTGIFDVLNQTRKGCTLDELASSTQVSKYGVKVLVEAALTAGFVSEEDGVYTLSLIHISEPTRRS